MAPVYKNCFLGLKSVIIALGLLFISTGLLYADTFFVGPGRTYTDLQSVASLLRPGDVVEVDGNVTYPGGVTFRQTGDPNDKITIRGIRVNGRRPVISGGTNTVAFVTPSPYSSPGADHYVFEGFEVTGGSSRGIYHQADDLTIRDVVVYDCFGQGIHGADNGSGSLTMEHVEVYNCGSGVYRHQIYMATDEVNSPGSVFRMQYCYIHDGNGGNNIKSRAERNEIYYNWIENAYYHEIELIGPDGGDNGNSQLAREDSDVVGNVLRKTTRNGFVTRVGGDGTGETNGRYRFVNNTIICDRSAVFRLFDGIESIEMHNNVFVHNAGGTVNLVRSVDANWYSGSEQIAGSNNWVPQGTLNIPSQWTGTIVGTTPDFEDFSNADFRPVDGGNLTDGANASPAGIPGYPFPNPLFPPGFHPPLNTAGMPGSEQARTHDGHLDIGAYEASGSMQPVCNNDGYCDTGENAANCPNDCPAPADTTAPSIPANLHAAVVSSSQIDLSWDASSDNVGVVGYRIYRDGTLLTTTTALSYSDTGLSAGTAHSYRLSAYDAAGNVSNQSNVASATTMPDTSSVGGSSTGGSSNENNSGGSSGCFILSTQYQLK